MNPEQLAKPGCNEHMEQVALFCWANMAMRCGFEHANNLHSYALPIEKLWTPKPIPQLKWLHAIPNAGARGNKIAASELKAEGVKAGVADIFLPAYKTECDFGPIRHAGLYVELKRANGVPSDVTKEQKEFGKFVESQGYKWVACFGWKQAAKFIQEYLT